MADITALFGVIGMAFVTVLLTEVVQYFLLYNTSSFRSLKENLEKHAAKVAEARSDASSSKAVKKREAKLQEWENEAGRQLASINMKSGAIMMISVVLSWRLIPRFFGNTVVLRLPFEPPSFFQKATHRGLEGADPRDASAVFVFMLCQATFRAILGKALGWGPSRKMSEAKFPVPKAFKLE